MTPSSHDRLVAAQRELLGRLGDGPPRLHRLLEDEVAEPPALFGVETQEAELYERLKRAAQLRESTSVIVCGYEGSGKHALLRRVLWRLGRDEAAYDVVHLSGAVHADAGVALREVVRQLTARRSARLQSRYVDDLNMVVDELQRRVAERSAPLLVALSRLERFAEQQRQTLLYVLLDAMQSTATVVVGLTTDRNVLELFEKRVRSRLQNHHVVMAHASAAAAIAALEDRIGSVSCDAEYDRAHRQAWAALKADPSFAESLAAGVRLGLSTRSYLRIAAHAVGRLSARRPFLDAAGWQAAFDAHAPLSSRCWIRAVAALPPPQLALVLAYLRFERDDTIEYDLHRAAKQLDRLRRLNATAVAYDESVLLRAQAALVDAAVLKLAAPSQPSDDASLKHAPVRLAAALSLEDLWTALRTGALDCPTALRQWVLQDAA